MKHDYVFMCHVRVPIQWIVLSCLSSLSFTLSKQERNEKQINKTKIVVQKQSEIKCKTLVDVVVVVVVHRRSYVMIYFVYMVRSFSMGHWLALSLLSTDVHRMSRTIERSMDENVVLRRLRRRRHLFDDISSMHIENREYKA
jgi:hypothetical protein